jgi:glycine cleavage system aminomethyltransferase T
MHGGCTSFDLHECDLNRFEDFQLMPDFIRHKNEQNWIEIYDIKHPLQPMEAPRPLRVSPFYQRQNELGAVFLEGNGWERPQWYEENHRLLSGRRIPNRSGWESQFWSPMVGAEAQRTREAVALYDMTPLAKLEVSGPGAAQFLEMMASGYVDRSVGSMTYCLLLSDEGGIRSDITVARLGEELFQVGCNGRMDLEWLSAHAPSDCSVCVRDITPGTCCIGVWGPRSRDLIASLSSDDFSPEGFKYFRAKRARIRNVPVSALRISYVGELGWELYTSADMGLKLWDTLWAAGQPYGVIAAGRGALNSLRLEKGYRAFGTDMTFEHDPYEAGLAFAVKLDKPSFVGRSALLDRKKRVQRRLTCLTLDDASAVVMGKEPVFDRSKCVGYVTSAGYGYTIGRGIVYAWLPRELAEPGRLLCIKYFDRDVAATVSDEPLFDPQMARLRS